MLDHLRRGLGYQMPKLGPFAFRLFRRFGPKAIHSELFPEIEADLDLRDLTQLSTWWQGPRFEHPTLRILETWLKQGAATFFDIGANYGFFSCFALTADKQIRVHSFEPHPRSFQKLQTIKTDNQLDRLSCWNFGLGDAAYESTLHSNLIDLGHTTFGAHPGPETNIQTKALIRPFSEWRREQGIALPERPSWIAKVDVEGFEYRVLSGMKEELLNRCFNGLIVEMNPFTLEFCGTSPAAIYQLMGDCGYHARAPRDFDPSYPRESANAFFEPAP